MAYKRYNKCTKKKLAQGLVHDQTNVANSYYLTLKSFCEKQDDRQLVSFSKQRDNSLSNDKLNYKWR